MAESRIYRISFLSQGQVYEVYARGVAQGALFGFIEVEDIVFGEKSQVVVDPSEERLKHEFAGVKRTYLPMHAILRIDEVEKEGTSRIRRPESEAGSVTPFPIPMFKPGAGPGSDSKG
ncbi:MAG TPA: DUF1820 family protein [Thermoanaerobaculia bacterium]|nr:DUF1820 family protein [Thermoanaerobaculia bacterium]